MDVSKNRGGPPKSSHFNRVFHEINHPFWGTPIFGNTHMFDGCLSKVSPGMLGYLDLRGTCHVFLAKNHAKLSHKNGQFNFPIAKVLWRSLYLDLPNM